MARRKQGTRLPAPYLTRISLKPDAPAGSAGYPFDLPWLQDRDFALEFTTPVTIIVGENGTGKSTLIEALAGLAGYDEAGGGKGYMPVDHSMALDRSGVVLADAFRAAWLPKLTRGWFFKAESFFSVARHLDEMAQTYGGQAPDFLSWSHGEGFVRVFHERMSEQGFYLMDEPESALSPKRQLDLLRLLSDIQTTARAQVILATHSPLLMAVPGARLLEATRFGFLERSYTETAHFKLYRAFAADPEGFIQSALQDGDELP
jgi:predicted ATPase